MTKTQGHKKEPPPGKTAALYVIFSLTEFLNNDGAGFWSSEDGWTEEAAATRFTEHEIAKYRKPIQVDAVWMMAPSCMGLGGYLMRPSGKLAPGASDLFFWAEDAKHAVSQARNAEPQQKQWRVISVNGVKPSRAKEMN